MYAGMCINKVLKVRLRNKTLKNRKANIFAACFPGKTSIIMMIILKRHKDRKVPDSTCNTIQRAFVIKTLLCAKYPTRPGVDEKTGQTRLASPHRLSNQAL